MSSPTIIPSHTRINGRVATSGDLVIEGRCAGSIEVGGTVTIAAGALCEAFVRAHEARIEGHVAGTIICRRAISVGPDASVVGSLEAPTLEVHPAARVQGTGTPFDSLEPGPLTTPAPAVGPGKRVRVRVRGAGLRQPTPPPRGAGRGRGRKTAPRQAGTRQAGTRQAGTRTRRPVPAPPRLEGRVRMSRSRRAPAGRRGTPK